MLTGAVDVFAVHLDEDGSTGARHHVAQAGDGQLLTGGARLAATDVAPGMALLAVPSGAVTVVRLSRDEVLALLADPMERLLAVLALSEWAEAISAQLPRRRPPFASLAATPGAEVNPGAGQSLHCPWRSGVRARPHGHRAARLRRVHAGAGR